jgi:hypothetical protein
MMSMPSTAAIASACDKQDLLIQISIDVPLGASCITERRPRARGRAVTQRRVAATLDDGFRLGDGADVRDHHALGPTIKDAGGVVRVAGADAGNGV